MNAKKKAIPCEVYSRIVGYLRPVSNWNDGKQQEFKDRKVFKPTIGIRTEEKSPKNGETC